MRIIPFGLIWLLLGWVFLFIERAVLGHENSGPDTAIRVDFNILVFASLAVTGVGLFVGTIEVFFLDRLLGRLSLGSKILLKLFIYALLFFLISLVFFPLAASIEMELPLLDKRVWERYGSYLTSITHLSTNVQMAVSLGLSLFYAEMSENIGQGVMANFFTGKYHRPIEEDRIFMFLDMRSSTTIAEQLGHIKYFKLLRQYYADLSDPIIEHGGELYQYVGDEVIISWKPGTGRDNNHCIRCFFAMKEELEKRKDWYIKKFGLLPAFKAGLHYGKVTTGEIGVIKKEIFFTGDILNATARIQALCNTYDADILLSADLAGILDHGREFHFSSMGKQSLRGKKEKVELFTVNRVA